MSRSFIRSDHSNQLPSTEYRQCGLHNALSQAGLCSQFSYADGDGAHPSPLGFLTRLLDGGAPAEKEVDEKSGGQMIVSDQVAHEHLGNIALQSKPGGSYGAKPKDVRLRSGVHGQVRAASQMAAPITVPIIGTPLSVKPARFGFELGAKLP
jgi:hypothetical protein